MKIYDPADRITYIHMPGPASARATQPRPPVQDRAGLPNPASRPT